jgi:hypothetical protein
MLRPGEMVIDDSTLHQVINPLVAGERKAHGLVPRNYQTHPVGYFCPPMTAVDMPLIPQAEWSDRIKELVATQSQLSDIRLSGNAGQSIPSLDQNGRGYCWAHSSTSATTVVRAVNNQPYVALSAYAIACIVKNYADEGGWGAESADFITKRGVPSAEFWPMQSTNRSNDNPKTWENAALHKIQEGWMDLAQAEYDRNLTFAQVATCLLSRCPVVVDYNWWSHSICALDLIEASSAGIVPRTASGKKGAFGPDWDVTGGFGVRIWNSWGDSWSDRGMGILAPSKAVPDGSVGLRVITAAPT